MVRIWSELRGARTREQVADVATVGWVALWGFVAWQVYLALAGFAESGRLIRSGGVTMIDSGRTLGDALAGIPFVGEGLRDVARDAFAGAGAPLADFGTDGARGPGIGRSAVHPRLPRRGSTRSSRCVRSRAWTTRHCSISRRIRWETGPPAATTGWPERSSRASGCGPERCLRRAVRNRRADRFGTC
jgi:hypothetical protein